MSSRIRKTLTNAFYELLGLVSTKKQIDFLFKKDLGRTMNWNNPYDINEKINWLKIYGDTTMWSQLADKYLVREYIKEKGFEDMLVPLYGVWDRADDIDWDSLPNQFVMKVNNGSGDVLICNDKSQLDIKAETRKFSKLLHKRFGLATAEPHYLKIKPCVIAEKLLDISNQPGGSCSLVDYKIWTFNGRPESVFICYNRSTHKLQTALYDLNFKRMKQYERNDVHYQGSQLELDAPESFSCMLEAASVLSKGFPEVRVDFYDINGKPYFGEMTFTSQSGMMGYFTQEYLNLLGERCILPI